MPLEVWGPASAAHGEPTAAGSADQPPAEERALAHGILRAVPPRLHAVLERLAAVPSAAPLIEALALGLERRLHPALILAPALLAPSSRSVIELLLMGESRSTAPLGRQAESK